MYYFFVPLLLDSLEIFGYTHMHMKCNKCWQTSQVADLWNCFFGTGKVIELAANEIRNAIVFF